MNSKRDSVALAEYKGKTTFEQLEMAINGKKKLHQPASTLVFRADHVSDQRSKGFMDDLAFKLHCQDVGMKFIAIWRGARDSKNGDAFQTMAVMAEKETPSSPDYAFAAEIKGAIESGQLQAVPPVSSAVEFFNKNYAQTGIPKTSYQQMKRVYDTLGLVPPKAKRGPKPNSRLKSKSRNS